MNDINRPYRSEPDSPEPEPQDAAASVAGEPPRSGGPSAASGEISSISSPPSPRHLDPSTLATDPMRQQIDAATRAMRALDSPTARSLLDHMESPAARMARGDLDSPTARALRDYADSPIAKMTMRSHPRQRLSVTMRIRPRRAHFVLSWIRQLPRSCGSLRILPPLGCYAT